MEIRAARADEAQKVVDFYTELIEKMQSSEFHPTWEMGVYPTAEYLSSLVERGDVFIGLDGGRIIAAQVVNHDCNESYANMQWEVNAPESEIMIIHLLCVLPELEGRGLGTQLIAFAKDYSVKSSAKAIRLDVMEENLPAIRLYDKTGFKRLRTIRMYYESTGWSNFVMYEYKL